MRTRWLYAALVVAPAFVAGDALNSAARTLEDAPQQGTSEVKPASASSESTSGQAAQTAQKPRIFHRQPIFLGMLRRNNDIRRRAGLFPHRINPALTAAAQDHANYMASTGQFSHYVNGSPQYRANKFGFRGGVRENIAYGVASSDGAFNMWQASGAHYASIVSGTTEAGFGCAVGPGGQVYWVGVYATPAQGDPTGETDEVLAAAIAEEEAARKEAEKNVAQEQPADSNIAAVSAEEPLEAGAAVASAGNGTGENPAGNVNATNARPQNYYYYYPQNNRRRGLFRRG